MWRPRPFQRSKNKGLLCEAVERGDIHSVTRLLEMGVDINTRDEYEDCTLLMRACWNNKKDMVELLLTKLAAVNETSGDDGYTGLMIAALQRYENIFDVLLMTKGINVTKADHRGRTAIHWAAMRNRVTILERLLSCSISVDINDNDGCTPLWWAVYNGHLRCVEVLMKHGASHQHESESDGSPLEIAKRRGHSDVVEMMEESIRLRSHVFVERDMPITRQQYEQQIADEVEKMKEELRQSALVHESEVTRLRNEME